MDDEDGSSFRTLVVIQGCWVIWKNGIFYVSFFLHYIQRIWCTVYTNLKVLRFEDEDHYFVFMIPVFKASVRQSDTLWFAYNQTSFFLWKALMKLDVGEYLRKIVRIHLSITRHHTSNPQFVIIPSAISSTKKKIGSFQSIQQPSGGEIRVSVQLEAINVKTSIWYGIPAQCSSSARDPSYHLFLSHSRLNYESHSNARRRSECVTRSFFFYLTLSVYLSFRSLHRRISRSSMQSNVIRTSR